MNLLRLILSLLALTRHDPDDAAAGVSIGIQGGDQ